MIAWQLPTVASWSAERWLRDLMYLLAWSYSPSRCKRTVLMRRRSAYGKTCWSKRRERAQRTTSIDGDDNNYNDPDEHWCKIDWARRFEGLAREHLGRADFVPLVEYKSLGPDAMLAAPPPNHYVPSLCVRAQHTEGERLHFRLRDSRADPFPCSACRPLWPSTGSYVEQRISAIPNSCENGNKISGGRSPPPESALHV